MKSWQAGLLLIFVGVPVIWGVGYLFDKMVNLTFEPSLVPCYDRLGSEIKGMVCEDKPGYLGGMLAVLLTPLVIVFSLFMILEPRR